jgi:hypothetical protein
VSAVQEAGISSSGMSCVGMCKALAVVWGCSVDGVEETVKTGKLRVEPEKAALKLQRWTRVQGNHRLVLVLRAAMHRARLQKEYGSWLATNLGYHVHKQGPVPAAIARLGRYVVTPASPHVRDTLGLVDSYVPIM